MKEKRPPNDNRFKLTIFLYTLLTVNDIIPLKQIQKAMTINNIFNLIPQRLRKTHINLTCTDYMLALFPLLRNLDHNIDVNVFALKTVQFKMKFINEENNAIFTVINPFQTIKTRIFNTNTIRRIFRKTVTNPFMGYQLMTEIIADRHFTVRLRSNHSIKRIISKLSVSTQNSMRIFFHYASYIINRAKSFATPLRTRKNQSTARIKIKRMFALKFTPILQSIKSTTKIKRFPKSFFIQINHP